VSHFSDSQFVDTISLVSLAHLPLVLELYSIPFNKQSINTQSLTEAELVAADDAMGPLLWTKLFLAEQGYDYKKILH